MGEFVTRGIAIGFAAGVSAALLARRLSVTKRHPNLLGFAVAGTADAISRDYRRPMVYEKLLRLEAPLGERARSFLYSIRGGVEEGPTEIKSTQPWSGKIPAAPESSGKDKSFEGNVDWWGVPEVEPLARVPESYETENIKPDSRYGYSPKPVIVGGLNGTRTWDEIRRKNEDKGSPSD
jgi:hypothetical protein